MVVQNTAIGALIHQFAAQECANCFVAADLRQPERTPL